MGFSGRGLRVSLAVGLAVISHFALDWPVHPPDLALWPGSSVHVGLALWRALPTGWWLIELAVIATLWVFYWRRAIRDSTFGGRPVMIAGVLIALHVANSPWLSLL